MQTRTGRTSLATRLALVLALTALLTTTVLAAGCTHAPPNLSPAGVTAFTTTRVVKGLDAFRDVAIAAEAQTPSLVSTATTRKIVQYHQVTVTTIATLGSGWQTSAVTGLDAIVATLSPAERQTLGPYIALVKTVLAEVP